MSLRERRAPESTVHHVPHRIGWPRRCRDHVYSHRRPARECRGSAVHTHLAEHRRGALETRLGEHHQRTSLSFLVRAQRLTLRRKRPLHSHIRSLSLRDHPRRLGRASRPRGHRALPPRAPPHDVPTSREPHASNTADAPSQQDALTDGETACRRGRGGARRPRDALRGPAAGARSLLIVRTTRVTARARGRRAPEMADGA
jgi:hypothetical protein